MRCQNIQSLEHINSQLRAQTGTMLSKVIYGSEKDGTEAIKNYFHFVNKNNLHGPAVVAYHTRVNELKDYRRFVSQVVSERIGNVHKLIYEISKKDPDAKIETDIFKARLKIDYPKTLDDRISLASQGAVSSDRIQPKSAFKKFMVFLNRFIKIEE